MDFTSYYYLLIFIMKYVHSKQVVDVVNGMSQQSMEEAFNEDIYEDWEQAILQTMKNSPLKVGMTC